MAKNEKIMVYIVERDFEINAVFDFGANTGWFHRFNDSKDPKIPSPDVDPLIVYLSSYQKFDPPPDTAGTGRTILVSAASKAVIDTLEPGIHDFVPCEVRYGSKTNYTPHEYFVVRLNHFLSDPVDVEKCDCRIIIQPNGNRVWRKNSGKPLALKSDVIADKHIFTYQYLFCSDELHDALRAAGLGQGWAFEKQLEV